MPKYVPHIKPETTCKKVTEAKIRLGTKPNPLAKRR